MAAKKETKAGKKHEKKGLDKYETETTKDIEQRTLQIAKDIVDQIKGNRHPTFTTKVRGLSNVYFDEDKKYIQLGDKKTVRPFLNLGAARKFMQTMLVNDKCNEYLKEGKTASIREIYYELKRTVANTKENTFEGQGESDEVIVDVEHAANTIREKLGLHAEAKGSLYGDITLKDLKHDNDIFNCNSLGRGGWSIMSRIEPEEIEIVDVNADFVLVIETAAMYNRLIEERYARQHNAILIGTGGQGARGARRLVHRLRYEYDLPVIVFTDGDPYGWYIYSVIKSGSMALAAHSKYMAVPDARYVGMTITDVETYGLQNVTEKMKEGDIKRAKELMNYDWFKSKEWQSELKTAIDKKIRIEQQALANKSLDFVARKYLPEKIEKEIFL
ncbi:MAG TPA: DNA topoisomerase IV subunit A [archaeon]|jgi:DNA topoisomerase VI subunit A|nr:DNA topoisomerase IV subunit A [archaeon]